MCSYPPWSLARLFHAVQGMPTDHMMKGIHLEKVVYLALFASSCTNISLSCFDIVSLRPQYEITRFHTCACFLPSCLPASHFTTFLANFCRNIWPWKRLKQRPKRQAKILMRRNGNVNGRYLHPPFVAMPVLLPPFALTLASTANKRKDEWPRLASRGTPSGQSEKVKITRANFEGDCSP